MVRSATDLWRNYMRATVFGGDCPTTAKLEVTMRDGAQYIVNLWVKEVSTSSDSWDPSGRGQVIVITGIMKPSADGIVIKSTAAPAKPVKKIKLPTVKMSAARLRAADRAKVALEKKQAVLEAALRVTKAKLDEAASQRKLASEALLSSAVE
jgi:hypothetical protein